MKHVLFFLAMVVAVSVIGCQDNRITDPVMDTPETEGRLSKAAPGFIPISAVLREPIDVHDFTEIVGYAEYSTMLLPRDPAPPAPQLAIRVTLAVEATLQRVGSSEPVWRVAAKTQDELSVDELSDNAMLLKKSYTIFESKDGSEREDGVSLHMQFQIVGETVHFVKAWLQVEDGS